MQVEIELALHAAKPADIDDAAENAGGFEILIGDRSGYQINDEIDALAASGFLHLVRPGLIA